MANNTEAQDPATRWQLFKVDLRAVVGDRVVARLAREINYSPSSVYAAYKGDEYPSLQKTLAIVAACQGDVADWEKRWYWTKDDPEAPYVDKDWVSIDIEEAQRALSLKVELTQAMPRPSKLMNKMTIRTPGLSFVLMASAPGPSYNTWTVTLNGQIVTVTIDVQPSPRKE